MITRLGLHLEDGTLRVTVDGRPLVQDVAGVVRRVIDHPDRSLAGDYADLGLDEVPDRDVMAYFATDGAEREVLGCTCGTAGCWPLLARIMLGPREVQWSDVRHGFREWDYGGFGYTFATDDYLAELDAVDRLLRADPNSTGARGPW